MKKKAKRKSMQHHLVLQDISILLGNDQCFTTNRLQPAYSGGQGGLPGWAMTWAWSILCGRVWHGVLQGRLQRSSVLLWSRVQHCADSDAGPGAPKNNAVLAQGCTFSSKTCPCLRLISFTVALFLFSLLSFFWANSRYHYDPYICIAWGRSPTVPIQSLT